MRCLPILLAALLFAASGCQYFKFQYEPTGFSSTQHKYDVEEKIREWHAREERRQKLAELEQRLVREAGGGQDGRPARVVQNEMTTVAPAR